MHKTTNFHIPLFTFILLFGITAAGTVSLRCSSFCKRTMPLPFRREASQNIKQLSFGGEMPAFLG
jgi:hypothetical protein